MPSDVKEWTPIQEGRFHLRSMKPGETIPQYMVRTYPHSPHFRRERRQRIALLIRMARAESKRLSKTK